MPGRDAYLDGLLGLVGQLLDTIMVGTPLPKPEPAREPNDYVPHSRPSADNDWVAYAAFFMVGLSTCANLLLSGFAA